MVFQPETTTTVNDNSRNEFLSSDAAVLVMARKKTMAPPSAKPRESGPNPYDSFFAPRSSKRNWN